MIEEEIINYLNKFILKSGEELEENNTPNDSILTEIKIVKRTDRTYRVLGILAFSQNVDPVQMMDPELKDLGITIRKKIILNDHERQTFKWLEEGWILKEVRFEKDEKTIRSSYYRMGFRLYQYEQTMLVEKENAIRNEFHLLVGNISATLLKMEDSHTVKQIGALSINRIINQISENGLEATACFPKKWPIGKQLKFLHFILAFIQLAINKIEFDWKEIGSSYYKKIGGSKEFDLYKQEFIDLFEEWTTVPTDDFGLISLGQITPLYFSGHLSGKYSSYEWGTVHALTNLSISKEEYRTKATTLWLVENRAILTRLAADDCFLKETKSLLACVDGHMRSSHKNGINQILQNSELEQVIIWCDYDPDGLQIAREIYSTISHYQNIRFKWITPEQRIIDNWAQFEQHVNEFLRSRKMEQEEMVGGADIWRKWIQD